MPHRQSSAYHETAHVELSRAPERFTESNHLRIGPEQHVSRFLQSLAYKTRRDDTRRDETRRDRTRHNETRQDETGQDKTSKHLDIYIYIYTCTCTYTYTCKYVFIYIYTRPVRRTIADHLPVSRSSNLRVYCLWTDLTQRENCKS